MKKPVFWILVLLICLGFGIWSLGFGLGGCAVKQFSTTAPEVDSVFPADGAAGVELLIEIKAVFNKNVDPASVNSSTFTLVSSAGAVSGTVSYDAETKTASFFPYENLSLATEYTAVISDQVKVPVGDKMNEPFSWSFTTGSYQNAMGTLDTSFGDGTNQGFVIYQEKVLGIAHSSRGESMVLDPRGRIFVAGVSHHKIPDTAADFRNNMTVWKIMPDGSPDKTFGDGGVIHSNFEEEDCGRSIIITPGGKILVTGDRYSMDLSQNGLAIWRMLPDGSADLTFGTNGTVIYNPYDRGYSIALDLSGNIIVYAYSFGVRSPAGYKILRFDANGSFDAVLTSTPEGVVFRTENRTTDAEGKILWTAESTFTRSILTRYNSEGIKDPSFGINGSADIPAIGVEYETIGKSVAVDAFGRIIVMGVNNPPAFVTSDVEKMTVWRFK